jgi:hypothetical protein
MEKTQGLTFMLSDKARRRLGIPKLPLEDVLEAVIRTEAEPDLSVLSRWCGRYPEYTEALNDFFMRWQAADFAASLNRPEELAITTVRSVLDELRSEGRIPCEEHAESVEPFDRLVLAAVDELAGKGHRDNIAEKLSQTRGVRVLAASIAGVLSNLERRGLVWSREARSKRDPKDKGRRYFTTTLAGKRALRKGN